MICGKKLLLEGLIALALSQKYLLLKFQKFTPEHGKEIFPKQNKLIGLIHQTLWKGKFKDDALKGFLE